MSAAGLAAAVALGAAVILSDGQRRRLVLHRERAAGVVPELLALLDAWDAEGTFPMLVAPAGGLRVGPEAEAAQADYFARGLSKARTLRDTPHGRGGAIDLWPVSFDPSLALSTQGQARREWLAFATYAKARGFVWGGEWSSFVAPDGSRGDWPHFEVPDWRTLPFPPQVTP